MRKQVFEIVAAGLRDLNEELGYENLNDIHDGTPIFGKDFAIDSLSLVTLIVGLETDIDEAFGKKILLADEKAMSRSNSPFRAVGPLVDFVTARLRETDAGGNVNHRNQ